MIKIDNKNLCI